jgi:hypothetical protein
LGYENGFLVRKEFVEHYSNLLLKVREEDCWCRLKSVQIVFD